MSIITISRSLGCEGTAVARKVAEGLGVELYDDRKLEERAQALGLQADSVGSLAEWAPGVLDRLWSNRPQAYLDLVQAAVFEVARQGQGVILGHGSAVLLHDFNCALHVHLHASEAFRTRHLMERHGLPEAIAAMRIRRADHEQRGFFRFAFHADWNDPATYDLLINREKLSVGLTAELITTVARSHEIRECSAGALATMRRLALARAVEAALLAAQFGPHDIHVDVPEDGVVSLAGVLYDDETKDRALAATRALVGIRELRDHVAVVPLRAD